MLKKNTKVQKKQRKTAFLKKNDVFFQKVWQNVLKIKKFVLHLQWITVCIHILILYNHFLII